jgi:hypothetical protein
MCLVGDADEDYDKAGLPQEGSSGLRESLLRDTDR